MNLVCVLRKNSFITFVIPWALPNPISRVTIMTFVFTVFLLSCVFELDAD